MTHGTDRRIEARCYIGMCFCPNCGAPGSIFEVHRKNPSGPWRLKEYRVLHDRRAFDSPCYNAHGGMRTYCRIPQREGGAFNGSNSQLGGGFIKRSMIEHGEMSLEAAYRREIAPVAKAGLLLDTAEARKFFMPRGHG